MKSLEKTYKHLLDSSPIEPPDEVWNSISQELAIDDVWSGISSDLDLQTAVRFENIGILASFTAVFIAIYIWSFPPIIDSNQITTFPEEPGQETVIQSETQSPSIEELSTLDRSNKEAGAILVDDVTNDEIKISNRQLTPVDGEPMESGEGMSHTDRTSFPLAEMPYSSWLPGVTSMNLDWEMKEIKPLRHSQFNKMGLFAGVAGTVKNTWVLNNKTIAGFRSQELHTSKPVFGTEFGIVAGTGVSRNLSVTVEYYFTSSYAQAYDEYISGRYLRSSLEVDYNTVNILAGITFRDDPFTNRSSTLIIGPSIGLLKRAKESYDGSETDLTSQYKQTMLGFTGGVQKSYPVSSKLDLLMSIRMTYGITNIYKGTTVVPANFRITHPASIGFTMALTHDLFRK